MDAFPGNSHMPPPDKKKKDDIPKEKIEKVVSGEVIKRNKSLGRKFKDVFFDGQFKADAKYIVTGVLLPSFKNMVVDATTKGVERVVYGENAPRRPPTSILDYGRPKISYNTIAERGLRPGRSVMLPDQPPYVGGRSRDVGEIILNNREEAELVLERLDDIIEKYDVASVSDLCELIGQPSTYVDNKWGWDSLSTSGIRQIREGYLLDLPPLKPI